MERVIAKGPTQQIGTHILQVSKLNGSSVDPDKMKYLPAIVEKDSLSSSEMSTSPTLAKKEADHRVVSTSQGKQANMTTGYDLSKTDKRRILLLNVPDDIDYDYLELYLEYLSDEIEVECIDYARETLNSIVATFVRDIGK